jgi:hypothetical protein
MEARLPLGAYPRGVSTSIEPKRRSHVMLAKHVIFGIHVNDRVREVPDVQKMLTQYGCQIKTRIGLHHVEENLCSPRGLILLEMVGDEGLCNELAERLGAIEGVEVQRMVFDHPA